MTADDVRELVVRLPVDLHAQVKAYAEANDRSMASVIRLALRAYCTPPSNGTRADDILTPDELAELVRDVSLPVPPRGAYTRRRRALGLRTGPPALPGEATS